MMAEIHPSLTINK